MKYLFVFISIFCQLICNRNFAQSNQFLNYNRFINQAELAIVRKDYKNALFNFSQASDNHKLMAIDAQNALICSVLLEDENEIKHYGNLLSTVGLPATFFQKSVYSALKPKPYWQEIVQKSEANYQKNSHKNLKFITAVDSLSHLYTKVYSMVGPNTIDDPDSFAKIQLSIIQIRTALYYLFKQHFYPGDDLINFYLRDTTIVSFSTFDKILPSNYSHNSLYLMTNGEDSISEKFNIYRKEGVYNFKIKPDNFGSSLDLFAPSSFTDPVYYGTCGTFTIVEGKLCAVKDYYFNLQNKAVIDNNRLMMGMSNLDDYLTKTKFEQTKEYKNLGFKLPISSSYVVGEEMDTNRYVIVDTLSIAMVKPVIDTAKPSIKLLAINYPNDSFAIYSRHCQSAQLHIVDSEYFKAIMDYDSAFQYLKPFAVDLFNASLSCLSIKKEQLALKYCRQLAEKGLPKVFWNNNSFKFLKQNHPKEWKAIVRMSIQKRDSIMLHNSHFIKSVDSFLVADQYFDSVRVAQIRNKSYSKTERDSLNKSGEIKMKANIKAFQMFILQNGFPSEDKMGVNLEEDSFTISQGWNNWLVLILHSYQGSDILGDTTFAPILWQALKNGQIKPEIFAKVQDGGSDLLAKGNKKPYYGTALLIWKFNEKLYILKYRNTVAERNKINQ